MNRFRHKATVLKLMSKSVGDELVLLPWAAAKTIRQRCETCCGVRCAATQRSNSKRSVSVRLTGDACTRHEGKIPHSEP